MSSVIEEVRLYDGVQQDHRWVQELRLPVIGSNHPAYNFFITVGHPYEGDVNTVFDVAKPTNEEATILASYLQFMIAREKFPPYQVQKMQSQPLDTDSGRNTVSFVKRTNGTWAYSRLSWRNKTPVPAYNEAVQYSNVVDLLNLLEGNGEKWVQWKQDHNISS